MSENLPEHAEAVLAKMGSTQAALFEDPTRLLNLSDGDMMQLVHGLLVELGAVMPGIRRMVGLVAWAQWHRIPDGKYHGWLDDTANVIGVDAQTIVAWRRKVTKAESLALPTAAEQRSREQKTARQSRSGMNLPPPITVPPPPPPPRLTAPAIAPPTHRVEVADLLAALRSVDPTDLGPVMTPEEVREVRDFAAALVTIARGDRFGPASP